MRSYKRSCRGGGVRGVVERAAGGRLEKGELSKREKGPDTPLLLLLQVVHCPVAQIFSHPTFAFSTHSPFIITLSLIHR